MIRDAALNPDPIGARAGPVLLFDGDCGLCNAAVAFLLRIDRRGVLRFATLQGELGQAWLLANGLPVDDFDSIVFIRNWEGAETADPGGFALRTAGLVAALEACGGVGRVLAWVRFVPVALRDGAYRCIARFRYRVFGAWKPRPLPRREWAARFLDGSRA